MKSSLILLLAFVAMAHGQQFRNQTLTDRGSTNDVVPSPSPSPSPSPIATLGRAGNFTIHTAGNNTGNDTTTPSTSTLQPTVNATAISTNDSSLSVFPFINGQLVKLGPCTGLAIHTHDYTEHATADPNNKLPLKMVFVDPTGGVVTAEVLPGDTFVIPAGLVHYQINYGCSTSTFLATFPRPASTQLLLPSLAALPDILVFLKLTGLANGDRMGIDRNITTSLDSPPRFNTTDRASSLIPTDALANATDAATDPIPFVVNPVCAQKCI